MALPASGQISFEQIRAEFGGSGAISLSQYYRAGGRVPDDNFLTENTEGGFIPRSSTISFKDFLGTGDVGDNIIEYTTPSATLPGGGLSPYIFTVPKNVNKVEAIVIGAGGGGAGSNRFYAFTLVRTGAAGGGGGGYGRIFKRVSEGQQISIIVGNGGVGRYTNALEGIAGVPGGYSFASNPVGLYASGGGGGTVVNNRQFLTITPGSGGSWAGTTRGGDGASSSTSAAGGNSGAGANSFNNAGRGGNGASTQAGTTNGRNGYVRIRY